MFDGSQLTPGDRIAVGSSLLVLDDQFCSQLQPGDAVLGVAASGQLRRIPAAVRETVDNALESAVSAFRQIQSLPVGRIDSFFDRAADLLADDAVFDVIKSVNESDVASARHRGRSTTRLELTEKMRSDMVAAFRMWRDSKVNASEVTDVIEHSGWRVSQWRAPLGVVAFVFEGRPNVFADATGVLKSGNSVVFRIGSDALGTAKQIMASVIGPALEASGVPRGAVMLLDSPEHAAGWCLFSDQRVSLAVARGSGEAVSELGSIAQQAGVPVSLHGTGGAWMIVGSSVELERLGLVVQHSLDRKVCNTLNVVTVCRSNAPEVLPAVLGGAAVVSKGRGAIARVHCPDTGMGLVIDQARENLDESTRQSVILETGDDIPLSHEFEWEDDPEFQIVLVDSVDEAIELFNEHSPQFIVSVISEDVTEVERVWDRANAPFVGDGFTRWVDGQFALLRPELGLSNWQSGRLLSRSGVLSGDSAHTIRLRVQQQDPRLHR